MSTSASSRILVKRDAIIWSDNNCRGVCLFLCDFVLKTLHFACILHPFHQQMLSDSLFLSTSAKTARNRVTVSWHHHKRGKTKSSVLKRAARRERSLGDVTTTEAKRVVVVEVEMEDNGGDKWIRTRRKRRRKRIKKKRRRRKKISENNKTCQKVKLKRLSCTYFVLQVLLRHPEMLANKSNHRGCWRSHKFIWKSNKKHLDRRFINPAKLQPRRTDVRIKTVDLGDLLIIYL